MREYNDDNTIKQESVRLTFLRRVYCCRRFSIDFVVVVAAAVDAVAVVCHENNADFALNIESAHRLVPDKL